jgi:hypothetical protein
VGQPMATLGAQSGKLDSRNRKDTDRPGYR